MAVARAGEFVRMALINVRREYPNHLIHLLNGAGDARTPRALHPAFYGSYDWHSAVHSHWLLVRVLRWFPQIEVAASVRAVLDAHLIKENIAAECRYCEAPRRTGFERPYGLAWLLQLAAELHEWDSDHTRIWRTALRPLEQIAVSRFIAWLPKLSHPVRSGEHSQTAFALGLAYDYARVTQHAELVALIESRSRDFYLCDQNAPLTYEPSGHDFLSPALAEADLMRRILPPTEFASWLGKFLPQIPASANAPWLPPVESRDRAEGKLAHLDGLNLSRAWMLEGIASVLSESDARRMDLLAAARAHTEAGLTAVTDEHYEGSHWLPSFAVYLLTRRGIHEGV